MDELCEINAGKIPSTIIPFAASAEWYAAWLAAIRTDLSLSAAISKASASIGIAGKDFARTRITGNTGSLFLSIPIEGGGASLKKASGISKAVMADHGNWRHMHLGALEAAYGRTPFYQHIIPALNEIYASPIKLLSDFNSAIHDALCGFLGIGNPESVLDFYAFDHLSSIALRARELASRINFRHSILEALMLYGRETLLALVIPRPEPK